MRAPAEWIIPQWPAPAQVRALITTRGKNGASSGPYAQFNLGGNVGDEPSAVLHNRKLLRAHLPSEPKWLKQVHGTRVLDADVSAAGEEGDAAVARQSGTVCAILSADCLPLLLCDEQGTVIAAAHCGWRGLVAGVIEQTIRAMQAPPASLLAYLGPAIGPHAYEVGADVRDAFLRGDAGAEQAFAPCASGKWLANLYSLARQRLNRLGVKKISSGDYCTHTDKARFYSHRRDGHTGRMASLIWLDTKPDELSSQQV
ncbi:MAG TPA: peptidoglycan editing factor PgeF [Burkholderiales bacterium]|nr:peptidoglycan editing factor PgeF [Burkholderiales bacterium]